MIDAPIEQIEKEHIEKLISNEVGEHDTLEYKQELPGKTSKAKTEFLYDVSSFANARGGDLIYGIADHRDGDNRPTGLPVISGLNVNVSNEILWLYDILRRGVDPRIPGIEHREVRGFQNGSVLIIRIPKSWIGPHMVASDDACRFYSRRGTGKYILNVMEIRSAFLASNAIADNARRFRSERIAKVIEGDVPVSLGEKPKLLLHLIPMSALDPTNLRDVTKAATKSFAKLHPIGIADGLSSRCNIDGLLTKVNGSNCYVQVFRSGIIEAADGETFKYSAGSIELFELDHTILVALKRYLEAQRELSIPFPIIVMVTLLGLKNFKSKLTDKYNYFQNERTIDREVLMLPEIVMEDPNAEVSTIMRPICDALWQSFGFNESRNYNSNGKCELEL